MPLPVPDVERELTHTRRVRYEGYKRADGLWDIEAHLSDVKNHDYRLKTGVRRAGQPIHEMWLRLTIDRQLAFGEAQEDRGDGTRPFQLDQCHALETSSETVKKWYPKWHRGLRTDASR
jgi:hypothetical protein